MHPFDRDTNIIKHRSGVYKANITDNWSVNHNPNGGYLMAMLANAMLQESDKKVPLIITSNYITRGIPGEGDIKVNLISRSKQFDRFQAQLVQEGRERVHAIGTFADEPGEDEEESYDGGPPELAPIGDCIPIEPMADYTVYDGIDVRLEPSCAQWFLGKLSEKSQLKGWVKFREERVFDALSILLLADCFPPPVLASHGLIAWVPTLELSVNLRNQPTSPWLKCIFRTRFITGGILEEDGEVWDESGNLVALSRQIAQYKKLKV